MIVCSSRPTSSRTRRSCELIGHVAGLHELHDKNRLGVRLVGPGGSTLRTTKTDRTKYFGFRRLRPGRYGVFCSGMFGGMFNDIFLGNVVVAPGVTIGRVSVGSRTIQGTVAVRERPIPQEAVLELRCANGEGETHKAALDRYGRFFFSGLGRGDYLLSGRVPGQGYIDESIVRIDESDIAVDSIPLRPVPRLCLRIRGPRGGMTGRNYRLVIRTSDGASHEGAVARNDNGWFVECPLDSGAKYRVEVPGCEVVTGEVGAATDTAVVNIVARAHGLRRTERLVSVCWDKRRPSETAP
jgi:hypothetical protein